jgi:hypothetical protein
MSDTQAPTLPRKSMSGERSSRDILQSLLVLEDDRAFRLEQAENRYRKKVRTLKTAADAEIAD